MPTLDSLHGLADGRIDELWRLQDADLIDLTRITNDELQALCHLHSARFCRCEEARDIGPFCANDDDCDKTAPMRAIEAEAARRGLKLGDSPLVNGQ